MPVFSDNLMTRNYFRAKRKSSGCLLFKKIEKLHLFVLEMLYVLFHN